MFIGVRIDTEGTIRRSFLRCVGGITLTMTECPSAPSVAGVIEAIGGLSKELIPVEAQGVKLYSRACVTDYPRSSSVTRVAYTLGRSGNDFFILIVVYEIYEFSRRGTIIKKRP